MRSYPKPCAYCKRLLRPKKSSPADYPTAEAKHQARGLCTACYARPERRQQRIKALQDPETQHLRELMHANTVAGLERFMARIKGKSRSRV